MTPPAEETVLWQGSPSQWTNFGAYIVCLLLTAGVIAGYLFTPDRPIWILAGLALPLIYGLSRWWRTRGQRYEITSERIRISTGLLSRRTSEIELYRVRDYTVEEPFWLRLIGRGNLIIETADRTTTHVVIRAVPGVNALKDQVRAHTERMRQIRGVRDFEINPQ
ncbi:MAG: PH domain-containing protein [Opitutus sp.]